MNKKLLIFSLMASVAWPMTASALDLKEALAIAYKNNPELKAEQESLKSIDENLAQAISGFLPSVSATFDRSKEEGQFGSRREETNHPLTKSLSVTQPIFNGGESIARFKQAKNQIEAGRARLTRVEQEVLSSAVAAYVDVIRAREILNLNRNNEKVLGEQLESTKSQFKLGEATVTDVAQAESRLAKAVSDRVDAEGQYIETKAGFKSIYEIDVPEDISMPEILPETPSTLEEVMNKAMSNNPTLIFSKFNSAAADSGVWVNKAALLPDVNVFGEMERSDHLSASRSSNIDTDTVGITVRVPLYQSGSEYSRIRQSKRDAEKFKYFLRDATNQTISDATKIWQDLETNRANITSAEAAVKAAKVALDGVKEEQEVGSRTVLDVLDAEQELFDSEVRLITARRNEVVSAYNVLGVMGELTAKNLALDAEIYDPTKNYNKIKYQIIGF